MRLIQAYIKAHMVKWPAPDNGYWASHEGQLTAVLDFLVIPKEPLPPVCLIGAASAHKQMMGCPLPAALDTQCRPYHCQYTCRCQPQRGLLAIWDDPLQASVPSE